MEAMKKQASKLREQVAKQQQEVLRRLGNLVNETETIDDAELQCHEQLQNLYNSTRAAKHFQRDIVCWIEGFLSSSKKQMKIERKLAEDFCKYGMENQGSGSTLAKVALLFSTSQKLTTNEKETMLMTFSTQNRLRQAYQTMRKEFEWPSINGVMRPLVSGPLQASITGAPLEDARHMTHRYERLCQEVETQAAEVSRRCLKSTDSSTSIEASIKLQSAERKLNELQSAMMAIQREAIDSMLSVEDLQSKVTFQKLLVMIDAEKFYHHNVLATLDKLHEMIMEKQRSEPSSDSIREQIDVDVPPVHDDEPTTDRCDDPQDDSYFIAKVIHSFDAQEDGELTLPMGDFIVVRHVGSTGWSEGECRGRAGWFPSAYVERQDTDLNRKLIEPMYTSS